MQTVNPQPISLNNKKFLDELGLSHATQQLEAIVEVNPEPGLLANPAGPPPTRSWFDGWNIFMRKKNWICLYGTFIELLFTLILMLVWTSDSNYIA
jgi:ferredoxin